MRRFARAWIPFLLALLPACGGSPSADLYLRIAANQTENPFLKVKADYDAGISRGLFVRFDALKCNPISIDDVADHSGAGINWPANPNNPGTLGVSPTQSSYSIPSSELVEGTLYRVQVFALDTNSTRTHTGTSDCPVNLSNPDARNAVICFGANIPLNLPVCAGMRTWTSCPGVTTCP